MKFPEQYRWNNAPAGFGTNEGDPYGAFIIGGRYACGRQLRIIAADGEETGWEHVSVSIPESTKCPSWDEMCLVKNLFWDEDETVVQFHPPKSEYVNNHVGCLHLWRWIEGTIPIPPSNLVGIKSPGVV